MDPVACGRFEVGHAFHVGAHLQVYRPILKARWECIAKGDKILRSFGSIDVCQGSRLLAGTVAKVENRSAPKISRKLIFGRLCRCVAFQRPYGGPWSILDETIWSLTSPRVKRISGSRNFCYSPQKDFCNKICQEPTHAQAVKSKSRESRLKRDEIWFNRHRALDS